MGGRISAPMLDALALLRRGWSIPQAAKAVQVHVSALRRAAARARAQGDSDIPAPVPRGRPRSPNG